MAAEIPTILITVRCSGCGRKNQVQAARLRHALCGRCGEELSGSLPPDGRARFPTLPGDIVSAGKGVVARALGWWRTRDIWQRLRLCLWTLEAGYLAVLLLIAGCTAAGPERWWWSDLNQYVPQWFWAVPAALFLAGHLALARRWVWVPIAALAWVAGPTMGWCGSPAVSPGAGTQLRVMTYNLQGSGHWSIADEVKRHRPDLLFYQEGRSPLLIEGLHDSRGTAGVQSRWPLTDIERRGYLTDPYNGYTRCRTEISGRPVTLYSLHLETAREGLSVLQHRGSRGLRAFEGETSRRLYEAGTVTSAIAQDEGPVIVGGDFNAPVQSLILRAFLNLGLQDAFSAAGWGYGYTAGHQMKIGLHRSFVRIDHLLLSRQHFQVLRCWTGGDLPSDHRPVIADVVLLNPEA